MTHPSAFGYSAALRTVALVFAFELVVARLTSHFITGHDVAVSAAAWGALGLAIGCVVQLLAGRGALGAILGAAVARAPIAVMTTSLLLPVVAGDSIQTILFVLFVAAIPTWPVLVNRRGFPSAIEVIATLTVATVWALFRVADGWPELSVYAPMALVWLVVALFAQRLPVAVFCAVTAAVAASLVGEPPRTVWDGAAVPPRPELPDIYLLSLDTLRLDAAFSMESFQALAKQGVRFDAAQSPAPWTLPSMATVMTGEPPEVHGANLPGFKVAHPIAPGVPTLAESLRDLGYDTAAVIAANPFVGQSFGFRRGFAVFDHPWSASKNPLPQGRTISTLVRPILARVLRRGEGLPHRNGDVLVDRALQVVARRRERPLFLWVHFMDAHWEYDRLNSLPAEVRGHVEASRGDRSGDFFRGREDRRAAVRAAYQNQVQHLDRSLMRLVEVLGEQRARPAIAVLVADHGEELFERDDYGHGHHLHQELIGVPLVIAGLPDRVPGQRVATPVSLQALFSTLVSAAGGSVTDRKHDLFNPDTRSVHSSGFLAYRSATGHDMAARRGNWKAMFGDDGRAVLFDLATDPGETKDVSALHPEIVNALRPEPRGAEPRRARAAVLTETEREALRQLGYDPDE